MGFRISWNKREIEQQINRMSSELNNSKNDGFTAWEIKQDLLEIKFLIDELLEKSCTFGDVESDFLKELEKKKTWKILNDKKINN